MALFSIVFILLFFIGQAVKCNIGYSEDSFVLPVNLDDHSFNKTKECPVFNDQSCVGIRIGIPSTYGYGQAFVCNTRADGQSLYEWCKFTFPYSTCKNEYITGQDGKKRIATVCCCNTDLCNTDDMYPEGRQCYDVENSTRTETVCLKGHSRCILWEWYRHEMYARNKSSSHLGCSTKNDDTEFYCTYVAFDNRCINVDTKSLTIDARGVIFYLSGIFCCCNKDLCNTERQFPEFKCHVGIEGSTINELPCVSEMCVGFEFKRKGKLETSYHCSANGDILNFPLIWKNIPDVCQKHNIKPGHCIHVDAFKNFAGKLCCCDKSLCNTKEIFSKGTKLGNMKLLLIILSISIIII